MGCQRGCEEATSRLRQREAQAATLSTGAPRVGGLCLKCAQHEAVMAETHTNVHVQAIERLTKSVRGEPAPTHTRMQCDRIFKRG